MPSSPTASYRLDFVARSRPGRASVEALRARRVLSLGAPPDGELLPIETVTLVDAPRFAGRLGDVLDDVRQRLADGWRIAIATDQVDRLTELFEEQDIFPRRDRRRDASAAPLPLAPGTLEIRTSDLDSGWSAPESKLLLLADLEIFGFRKQTRRAHRRRHAESGPLAAALSPGDYVVHVDYGVGIFRGLVRLETGGVEREYLHVDYAKGDRLYVPVDQTDRVVRYSGGGIDPTLTRLGTGEWQQTRRRVRRAVREMAFELIQLYATRETDPGQALWPGHVVGPRAGVVLPLHRRLPTKQAAIDGGQERPRVVSADGSPGCRRRRIRQDRGRAASGVPGRQRRSAGGRSRADDRPGAPALHHVSAATRGVPGTRGNAFSPAQQSRAAGGDPGSGRRERRHRHRHTPSGPERRPVQESGPGRHRRGAALRRSPEGVPQEAADRGRRADDERDPDSPHTAHGACRYPRHQHDRHRAAGAAADPDVRHPHQDQLIREVILREIDRGGQVYFVHNRVHDIDRLAHKLRELVPEARFGVGHGQMDEEVLEEIVLGFVRKDFDVLISTTIIESGVDIPNVNTIIIDNADTLGLTQLYQLRGRVGRSTNRAYAYLLFKPDKALSAEAQERLVAIQEATELGAGLRLAMRDMEIRGAGNILGAEQSGHIAAVGYELYIRLLAQAVEEIRSGEPRRETGPVIMDLPLTALIPTDYIVDTELRLAMYRRIAAVEDERQLEEVRQELEDRFGPIPEEVEHLLALIALRIRAQALGIESMIEREREIVIRPVPTAGLEHRLVSRLGPCREADRALDPHSPAGPDDPLAGSRRRRARGGRVDPTPMELSGSLRVDRQ